MDTRQKILNAIEDLVGDLLYYDRKGDDDLPRGVIEGACADGTITVDEMVAHFRAQLGGLPGKTQWSG